MSEITFVILPLVLLVLVGFLAAKFQFLSETDWKGVERLSFTILIPALIINAIYGSELSMKTSGPYVLAAILAVVIIGLVTFSLRLILPKSTLPDAQLSTMIQTSTRWNALITLPIGAQLFGVDGLTTIAIAMAFLIPLINIGNIIMIAGLHAKALTLRSLLFTLAKNPMILGSIIGLSLNFSGIEPPKTMVTTLEMISRSALAVGLLCIGAGFDWRRLLLPSWQVIWGVLIKNIAAPLVFLGIATYFDLNQIETLCGMLVLATPTATNGYIVARQMGGDAELYAYTMSWQLVASIVTFPAMIYLMQG